MEILEIFMPLIIVVIVMLLVWVILNYPKEK
jgi:hypothetical protein